MNLDNYQQYSKIIVYILRCAAQSAIEDPRDLNYVSNIHVITKKNVDLNYVFVETFQRQKTNDVPKKMFKNLKLFY